MPRPLTAIVTCEHASRRVPAAWAATLRLGREQLASHRGSDMGAAAVARELASAIEAPLLLGQISRLVVDLNRSPDNPRRWSSASRALPTDTRAAIMAAYHEPHWDRAIELVTRQRRLGRVLHIGVHSFTPVLRGRVRAMDVAFLYDPSRRFEVAIVRAWQAALRRVAPELVVRRNAPYRGVDDGLTRALRRRFPDRDYAGIELELNQNWLRAGRFPSGLVRAILHALREVLT